MTPLNAYVLVHRTDWSVLRAIEDAAVPRITIILVVAILMAVGSVTEIRSCGDKALAGYERAREMDGMPTLTEKQARYNR